MRGCWYAGASSSARTPGGWGSGLQGASSSGARGLCTQLCSSVRMVGQGAEGEVADLSLLRASTSVWWLGKRMADAGCQQQWQR